MDITDDGWLQSAQLPVQPVHSDDAARRDIRLGMLRLDMLDVLVSGNKWFKLIRNLQAARAGHHIAVLTFGGAWSNHLVATAAAAARAGFQSIGIVRGLHGAARPTPALQQCTALGMQLRFLSRADYARHREPAFTEQLCRDYQRPYLIPEGGANAAGREGAALIAPYIGAHYTHICVSAGTGTTLAGLRAALPPAQHITGFAPMKGGAYISRQIAGWLPPAQNTNWHITDAYHFGGFGKVPEHLLQFIRQFRQEQNIPLDRVYTAKMMYGVLELIRQQYFPEGARILCIHTGGCQGELISHNS